MIRLLFSIVVILVALPCVSSAMTDNGDGTRTFYVGSGLDFEDYASIVWGHPAGVSLGDKLTIGSTLYQILETGGEYKAFTYVIRTFFEFANPEIIIYAP